MRETKLEQETFYLVHEGRTPVAIEATRSAARSAKKTLQEQSSSPLKIMQCTVYSKEVR
jgi:hypothetical protein